MASTTMADKPISSKRLIAAKQNIKEKEFWLSRLAGDPVKSRFYYDNIQGGEDDRHFSTETFRFTGELYEKLMQLSNKSDPRLHIILAAVLIMLVEKYTGDKDVMIGAPVYKQDLDINFINTVLVLRNRLTEDMTFKDLLLQVRQTVSEAVEHVNYPLEVLLELLNIEFIEENDFPLFDISILLEGIHDAAYTRGVNHNVKFSFKKNDRFLEGTVEYNSSLYHRETVKRIISHYRILLGNALSDINLPIRDIDVLTGEERDRLLYDFNHTKTDPPPSKTIHRWFEEQVEKTPDRIAASSPVDLSGIFDQLDAETTDPALNPKMETLCFKENPYLYRHEIQLPADNRNGTHLNILKTHRHNSVVVNDNLAELLGFFDGSKNLASIYRLVKDIEKSKGTPPEFLVYSMTGTDLLEVTFQFDAHPAIFSIHRFEDLVGLIRLLFKNHLIGLVDIGGENSPVEQPVIENFGKDRRSTITGETGFNLEKILTADKELTESQVLLLGDTPGTASVGLLYLASYLAREGIKASCRFYDPDRNYTSMKANIEALLEKIRPKIAAISLKWFLYISRVLDIAAVIKEYAAARSLDIKIVVGGNTASYYWEDLIKYDNIDYLVRGDGEEPLLKLCRGEDIAAIENIVYKKDGNIIENPVTYIQDESSSKDIYLSHLDDLLLSNNAQRFGAFFIYTHKGCAMNCLYCGGCSRAQRKTFNRKKVLLRRVDEVRKDIREAKKFTSTFHFEFDIPDKNIVDYCKRIWEGIDLSSHFCIFSMLPQPTADLIALVCRTFKYVYWDYDVCTLSRRHREQLHSLGLVKPQPSDEDVLAFMSRCEEYRNIEVRLNLITGLPYFKEEDIVPGEEFLSRILNNYRSFGELHWARLHAQPGAPIVEDPGKHRMHSYASTFDDFLKYSMENYNQTAGYTSVEEFKYPYIYFIDDGLNSRVTHFYMEINKRLEQYRRRRQRGLLICDTLTYRELNEKAGRLAERLRSGGIVGLMLERSLDIPVGILGTLKAGCAYMPIDPEFPAGRVEYMLADSSAAALVTTRRLFEDSEKRIRWDGETVFLDTELTPAAHRPSSPPSSPPGDAETLAYVIYTSGSTGKPKGVLLKQSNLVNYVHWFTTAADLKENDKTVLTSSFAFDLGYTSLYTSLLNGGELHIPPREIYLLAEVLLDYIKQKGITYIKMTPSLFSTIVNHPSFSAETCKTLRLAAIGGEAINVKDIETAHSLCPHLRVMNHYGPTEATIGCVATFVEPGGFENYKKYPAIGRPIDNTNAYILGGDLRLMPVGVPGELCISGTCLARGYLNRPELTAEKFAAGHLSSVNGQSPLYRTGDLARRLPDGNIEFLGRVDNQVKIRGYRVELGEIEKRIQAHHRIEKAVLTVKEAESKGDAPGSGEKYLCAYIVPGKETADGAAEGTEDKKPLKSKDIAPAGFTARFRQQVTENRGKAAVESKNRSLTYASLDEYSDRTARKIVEKYDGRYKLSAAERTRYKRQMLLHGWGPESQEKLKSATVFVAGAGGGASPTIVQLALAGFGTIKVCDFDVVELSNLNRQFLHDEERLGMNKALSAQIAVEKINPNVKVIPYTGKLTGENVFEMVGDSDIIFDMFDNPADKFTLSECAVARGIPHVIISMTDINAYSAVLHTPETPCYHCLFDKKKLETIVSGMQANVENYSKNPLPVVATSLFVSTGTAVNEALKILLGFKKPAYNKFFYFNQRGEEENLVYTQGYKAMTYLFSEHFLQSCREQGFDWDTGWRGNYMEEFSITRDPACPLCGTKGEERRKTLGTQMKAAAPVPGVDAEKEEQPGTVALLLDPGINLAAGHIGTLKAGKTAVPLSPGASPERSAYILEDCEARVILTDGRRLGPAKELRDNVNKNIEIIDMDEPDETGKGDIALKAGPDPEHVVCMFYPPYPDAPVRALYDILAKGNGPHVFEDTGSETKHPSLSSELLEYLSEELPGYMLPSRFVELDAIPLTPNGKVDTKKLPEPGMEEGEELAAPAGELEEKLLEIWCDVLGTGRDRIGTGTNFFQVGGHSLNATIMTTKIHDQLDVEVPLAEVFKRPTIKGLAALIGRSGKDYLAPIEPVEKKEYYPVSSAQKRMFILKQLKGEHTTSDSILVVRLMEGKLDTKRFEESILALIKRHEALRTSFVMIDQQIVQKVIPFREIIEGAHFKIDYMESNQEEIPAVIKKCVRPFDLAKAPLLRLGLAGISKEKYVLVLDMHHIIMDGTSGSILVRDFMQIFNGMEPPGLTIQYKDFSNWQNNFLESGALREQEEYWLSVYSDEGNIPVLNMPTDFPRPRVEVFKGGLIRFALDDRLSAEVKQFLAERSGTTLFMFFLAVYNILLSRYTGQTDIIIGVPIQGRRHPDLENVVGFFANTLAMRNYPRGEKTFAQFLDEVKENAVNAYRNQDYQLEELVGKLNIKPDVSRQPLFSTMLQHGNINRPANEPPAAPEENRLNPDAGELTVGVYDFEEPAIQFDLLLHLLERNDIVGFKLLYSAALFKKETIDEFTLHLVNIVREAVSNPHLKLSEVEMFSHRDEEALLREEQEKLDKLEVDLDF